MKTKIIMSINVFSDWPPLPLSNWKLSTNAVREYAKQEEVRISSADGLLWRNYFVN